MTVYRTPGENPPETPEPQGRIVYRVDLTDHYRDLCNQQMARSRFLMKVAFAWFVVAQLLAVFARLMAGE